MKKKTKKLSIWEAFLSVFIDAFFRPKKRKEGETP
jgi:hypothetical protein